MGKYYELVSKAMDNGAGCEAWQVAEEIMDEVARRDPNLYDELIAKMEHLAYRIPKDEAERIVRNMRPKGQYWSLQQIREYLKTKGITENCVNWYLVMNMVYNDFYDTARTFGLQSDVEFFFSLAKDFIEDPDAKPMKVEKYFLD